MASSSGNESVEVPEVGRIFSSEENLRAFYRTYAYQMGFGICKISGRIKKDIYYYTLACTRHGHYVFGSTHPRPTTACDYPARVNVRVADGQYEIMKVDLNHNHDLSPNKDSTLVHEAGGHDNMTSNQMREYDGLLRLARPVHELAVKHKDSKALEWWKEHINAGMKKLLSWASEVNCQSTCDVGDPLTRRRRGRPPTQRKKSMAERPQRKKGKMAVGESSYTQEETTLPTQTSLPTYLSQTSRVESGDNSPQPSSLPTYTAPTPERRSYSDVFCQSEDTPAWNFGTAFSGYRDRIESEDSD